MRPAIMLLLAAAVLTAACQAAPSESAPSAATVTITAPLVTITAPPVTVTAPPVTIRNTVSVTVAAPAENVTETVTLPGPRDVTSAYIPWRKKHFDRAHSDNGQQYTRVLQVLLQPDGGLDVITNMRRGVGGWSCAGEPASLEGVPILWVRILYTDGTVFRLCPPGS